MKPSQIIIFFFMTLFVLQSCVNQNKISADNSKPLHEPIILSHPWVKIPPKPLSKISPIYPDSAKKAGIEGKVYVEVLVDENGIVKEMRVVEGFPNSGLNEAAIEAIGKTIFSPAKTNDNKPIQWRMTIPITFSLNNEK